MVDIQILGSLVVTCNGQPLPNKLLRDAKTRSLLKLLALRRDQLVPQEVLIDLCWPDSDLDAGRASLYAAVSHLRRALQQGGETATPVIVRRAPGYMLVTGPGCGVDLDRYERSLSEADRLAATGDWEGVWRTTTAAEGLVTGELLDCELYAEWAEEARRHFSRTRTRLLDLAMASSARLGKWTEVVAFARCSLTLDRAREGAYRYLLQAYGALQEPALAVRAYEECREALSDELGLEPGHATEQLYQQILLAPQRQAAAAQQASTRASLGPGYLPAPHTSFIGREEEVPELVGLVRTCRLVTLVGTGGAGKSRLSLRTAAELQADFPDGTWFVDLAPISDARLVSSTVAAVMGIKADGVTSVSERLVDELAERRPLIILDNCEHLVAAAADFALQLLSQCPGVHLLTTTREPLRVEGETLWHVRPLPVPEDEQSRSVKELLRYDSIRLFADRARQVQRTFALDQRNADSVVWICRRLDGLPLALELAAARVKFLQPNEMAARLDESLRFLTSDSRFKPARQQTLQALVDWSHGLLSEPERVLWRRLAIFPGRFTLAAAEAVCSGGALQLGQVLDLLTGLVDKSLVVADGLDDQGCFRLLETMRTFSAERLEQAGEVEQTRDAHMAYFLRWVDVLDTTAQVHQERENLRAAVQWARIRSDVEAELRFLVRLYERWASQPVVDLSQWVAEVIALPDAAAFESLYAQAIYAAGQITFWQGRLGEAADYFEQYLAFARARADERAVMIGLRRLGFVALLAAEYDRVRACLYEADQLDAALAAELRFLRAGLYLYSGELEAARQAHDLAWQSGTLSGDRHAVAHAAFGIGQVDVLVGDHASARPYLEEALRFYREYGDGRYTAWVLVFLALLCQAEGDLPGARSYFRESLCLYRQTRGAFTLGQAECLDGVSTLLLAEGAPDEAAQILAVADRLRSLVGMPVPLVMRPAHDALSSAIRAALPERALAAATAQGRVLSPAKGLDLALQLLQ